MSTGPPYSYTWAPARPPVARVSTSRRELWHILIAFVVLSVDFVLILGGVGYFVRGPGAPFSEVDLAVILTALAAAFTGFLCHELAHKVYAQRHGFWAEFRMSPMGLVLSLITSSFGFLWAAPGATVVSGMSEFDRENWGRTSLAGPISNAAFGGAFYAATAAAYLAGSVLFPWLAFLAFMNGWFATFNLIPFGPLDGAKVIRWNRPVWIVTIVGLGALTVVSYGVAAGIWSPLLMR